MLEAEISKVTHVLKFELIWNSAGHGNAVLVQFVETFHIEISEDGLCLYDYLEIRDGKFGYSPVKDKGTCGSQPPTLVQSSGQYLWLRFHSDQSIGYKGFRAIVTILQGAGRNFIHNLPNFYIGSQVVYVI